MKMVEFVGLSGPIKFDASGLRTQFAMDLMELQMEGLAKVSLSVIDVQSYFKNGSVQELPYQSAGWDVEQSGQAEPGPGGEGGGLGCRVSPIGKQDIRHLCRLGEAE